MHGLLPYVKWKKSREPKDVAEAVQAGRAAAAALLPSDASNRSVFINLTVSLKGHFRYSNQVEDLDDTIKYGTLVLTCFAHGSHQWNSREDIQNTPMPTLTLEPDLRIQLGSHKALPTIKKTRPFSNL